MPVRPPHAPPLEPKRKINRFVHSVAALRPAQGDGAHDR